jgi:hypothetical protein
VRPEQLHLLLPAESSIPARPSAGCLVRLTRGPHLLC